MGAVTKVCTKKTQVDSGGSWGLGALGPAILWGSLQGRDPTFPSWSVGEGAQGAVRVKRCKPHNGVRG